MGTGLLLYGLAKYTEHTRNPYFSAIIYAVAVLLSGLASPSKSLATVLAGATISFLATWLLFWLLDYFQDQILLWVLTLGGGLLLLFAGNFVALRLTLGI